MTSERTKACAITPKVKRKVYERDGGCCLICGLQGLPEAHFVPRSAGGLGIEENIITLCRNCHRRFDQSEDRPKIKAILKAYLKSCYEDWDEEKLIFKKYGGQL